MDERTFANKSGGRKPPVVAGTLMHHKTLYRTVTLAHANKSGGRKPPWFRYRVCTGESAHVRGPTSPVESGEA